MAIVAARDYLTYKGETVLREKAILTVVILALLGVGCGSSDDTGDTPTSTLSKAEFIKRADAICKRTREEVVYPAAERVLSLPPGSPARRKLELKLVSSAFVPGLEKLLAELGELGAPAGDEAEIERIIELTEPALEEARTEPETYVAGKDYRFGEEHYGKAYQAAQDYGMKECPMR